MKHLLLTSAILLVTTAAAVAQDYPATQEVRRNFASGSRTEEKAVERLTASNQISSGAVAYYAAGKSVVLKPGFVAQSGAVFHAYIESVVFHNLRNENTLTVTAYPNPFDAVSTVEYTLPTAAKVSLTLTNSEGKVIQQATKGELQDNGRHQVKIDGANLPVGVYVYQVQTGEELKTIRLLKK
jgi:hypothetical protein